MNSTAMTRFSACFSFAFSVLLSLLSTPAHAGPAQLLKVLTFNFNSEAAFEDRSQKLRDLRYPVIIDWVKKNDPDIIFLQELWNYHKDPTVALTMARDLGYDINYRLTVGFPDVVLDSNAVLTKKNFQMRDRHEVELPHGAPHWGDGKSWILVLGPVSWGVGAKLTLNNGEPLYVYTTHLIGDTEKQRFDQIVALNQAIKKQVIADGGDWESAKVLLAGDMNLNGGAMTVYLESEGYYDSWNVAHPGIDANTDCTDPVASCYNPTGVGGNLLPSQNGLANLGVGTPDHIFVHGKNAKALASTVIFTTPRNGMWMSDHYGLFSTIGVNGEMPLDIPNPVKDDDQELPPTVLLPLTSKNFECGANSINGETCEATFAPITVPGPKGLTIRNFAERGHLRVQMDGPGEIYISPITSVEPNGILSFVFTQAGDYTYLIRDHFGNAIRGKIHVLKGT